jgi:16S rRNA (uracil1498-N3)-methyltransferase
VTADARVYAPAAAGSDLVEIEGDEAHHLVHVLRLGRPGCEVRVFDGRGHEWRAAVVAAGRRSARLRLLEPVTPAAEPPVRMLLALGILKADGMEQAVRDAAMLGVSAIQPLVTRRTAVPARAAPALAARWRRVAIASVKQCGRAVVPHIAEPADLDGWLAQPLAGVRLVLVEPAHGAGDTVALAGLSARARAEGAVLAVGPEGGWSPEETSRLAGAGFLRWSLGARTLRAAAAPCAALAILLYAWEVCHPAPGA